MKASLFTALHRPALLALALIGALLVTTMRPAAQAAPVPAGSRVTFVATAEGSPAPTFQWKKDGAEITGATDASLVLEAVTADHAGTYRVTACNIAGTADSTDEVLSVEAAPVPVTVAPVFTVQPVALQVAAAGATVTIAAGATGTPEPSYQWKKDGVAVAGATSGCLTLANVTSAVAGSYQVVATNSAGSATSSAGVLIVNTPPVIVTQPAAAQTAVAGATLTLSVTVVGSPAPALQWRKNDTAISGATSATLTLANLCAADAATYTVSAANAAGSVTSTPAVISVNTPPAITAQPAPTQSVTAGASITLRVTATGVPAPTYQWRKDGNAIAGATSATLTLANVTATDAATYTVTATNAAGSVTSSPAVLVVATPPVIATQPVATQTVIAGTAAKLSVTVTGTPAPTFQWKKNGTAITGGTASTLTFTSVALTDAATYTVVATNASGAVTSTASVLVVNAPPVITKQPVSQTVATRTTVTFTVSATGFPAPTYQWRKNGSRINGATSTTLRLNQVRSSDAATYTVDVRNSLGTVTSTGAKLVVGGSSSSSIPATSGYVATAATTEEATPAAAPSRIINVSVRSRVGGDDRSLIVGFVVGGESAQPVLLRGVGPTLATLGVSDVLRDPQLALYTGQTLTAANAGWSTAADAAEISDAGAVLGAFRLSDSSRDAALLPTLAAGAYTVQLSGQSGHAGDALLEAYAGLADDSAGLVNLSVRARVGSGTDTPQVGFVISGTAAKRVLIRAVGPTLAAFGLTGVLANPHLELFRQGVAIDANDNWGGAAELRAAFSRVGAFDFADQQSRDAVLLVTLEPGSYSVVTSGVGGSTGLALIEVYDAP